MADDLLTKDDIKPKTPAQEEREMERLKAKLYQQEQDNARLQKQLEEAQAEKRKPGITQVEEDGTQSKKKRPNSFGLSDQVMPPYTKKRVAIYQIVNGDDGINPATNLPVEAVPVLIHGSGYMFSDKFEKDPAKRQKFIKNVKGYERVVNKDGKEVDEEVIEDILFDRGWKQVVIEDNYMEHLYLELHPNNKSNRFRPQNAPIIFERVDINMSSIASQSAAIDLTLDAGMAVKNMNKEEVYAFASSVSEINAAAGRAVHEIRTDLQKWAMSNPIPFFKLNKNTKAGIQIVVLDALNFGLIGYRADKKAYVDMETDEIISAHTAAEEPMQRLVKYLGSDEGQAWYKQIQDRMNYWKND